MYEYRSSLLTVSKIWKLKFFMIDPLLIGILSHFNTNLSFTGSVVQFIRESRWLDWRILPCGSPGYCVMLVLTHHSHSLLFSSEVMMDVAFWFQEMKTGWHRTSHIEIYLQKNLSLLPILPVWKQLRRKMLQEKSLKYALPH